MNPDQLPALSASVLVIAGLYSSVGHAGASGYIAVMTLFGLAPAFIKPTALALNILVASVTTWQFWRSGHFSWRQFWPFALLSVPMAFVGGYVSLPTQAFKVLVGCVLLASAARLLWRPPDESEPTPPPRLPSLLLGAAIGLLSGLTGTGGGIFLTPILLFKRWARVRTAGALSAAFILVNSAAGLIGFVSAQGHVSMPSLALLAGAAVGGTVGSHLGSRRLPATAIKRLLAVVLCIAGAKLLAG